MLHALYDNTNPTSPFDISVRTVALDAFWGQCCLGELLLDSVASFHPSRHPTVTSLSFDTDSATIRLLWSKTKKAHGDIVVLTSQLCPLNPTTAHWQHTAINPAPAHSHLYAYRIGNLFHPLTRNTFLRRCIAIWSARGYPSALATPSGLGAQPSSSWPESTWTSLRPWEGGPRTPSLYTSIRWAILPPCMLPTSRPAARSYQYPLYIYVSQIGTCSTYWKTHSCSHPLLQKIPSSHHPFIKCLMSCCCLALQPLALTYTKSCRVLQGPYSQPGRGTH
jgi:hypothetical protein